MLKELPQHGVFMLIAKLGVLITGKAGAGKSELALDLISRGHPLIADDHVLIDTSLPKKLIGYCPPLLQDYLEVRGLGLLNIKALFGDQAIAKQHSIDLIIHLDPDLSQATLSSEERLHGRRDSLDWEQHAIPRIHLPSSSGRNLAVLTEIAVHDHKLRAKGYNAAQQFCDRHQQQLSNKTS